MKVCVFAAASNNIDPLYMEAAQQLGSKLAQQGHQLVFGGGSYGLMGAMARGFYQQDGYIISVSPKLFNRAGVLFEGFDELYLTEDLKQRKEVMLKLSDAFITLPGGTGTMDEFFEVYAHNQLGYCNKPLILYNINGFYDSLYQFLKQACKEQFISAENMERCLLAGSSGEVLEMLQR